MSRPKREIELLEASRQGRTEAFEQIVLRYQPLVCAITFSGTGRQDLSEELAQESFLQAWRCLGQLKDLGKFRSWLCSITRSVIQNYIRKKRKDLLQGAEEIQPYQLSSADDSIPANQLINREEKMMLQQAILRIPEAYREPLVLFYRQQQSISEVADLLNLNENTVRTRLHRGRQMLKEEVLAMVERNLEKTAPGPRFTKAVMIAIGGLAVGTAATAEAAQSGATLTGASTGMVTTALTGAGAKIAALAAAVIIGVGGYFVYQHLSDQPEVQPTEPVTVTKQSSKQDPLKDLQSSEERPDTAAPARSVSFVPSEAVQADSAKAAVETPPAMETRMKTTVPADVMTTKAEEYQFRPRGVLSGLITDAKTGVPITDTEIRVTSGRIYQTRTDEYGFYAIDRIDKDANYKISINSWDHIGIDFNADRPPTVNLQKGKQLVRHFQLEKACQVELTVLDEAGQPIPNAKVHVSRVKDSRGWPVGAEEYGGSGNKTNKEGFVLLGGYPPNDTYFITIQHSYDVKDENRNVWTHRYDYAPAGVEVFLEDPNRIEKIVVTLRKGQKVRGYVQYQDGEPADDITIVPQPDWWHANRWIPSFPVEPNGFFTLEYILPGIYNIQARIPEGDGWVGKSVLHAELPLKDREILEVQLPFKSPEKLVSISGSIKWIGDERPNYIEIDAYSAAYGHYSTRLRNFDQETFEIKRMVPGTYQLKVEGEHIEPVTIENVRAPSENLVLELTCTQKPRLYGLVMDSLTKKTLPKYEVRVRKLETLRGASYAQSDQWIAFENEHGRFEVEVVGPGIYDIQARAEGYAPAWSQKINTDQNPAVLIHLSAGGSIRGYVVNEDNEPVSEAWVIPLSKAGGTNRITQPVFVSMEGAVKTNEAGEFYLAGLPPGIETIKVTHPDYTFVTKGGIEVKEGHCTDDIHVILPRGAVIEGIVYDQNNEPQGGVVIRAQNDMSYSVTSEDPGILATAVSEPNGFYRIAGLPEEVCYLMRQDEGNAFGVVRRTILPQNGRTVRVDFGGSGVLTGQILLEEQPLANRKIVISSPSSYYSGSLKMVLRTDSEGRFIARGIIPGRYGIFYEMNQQRSEWFRLVEFEMKSDVQDLGIIPKDVSVMYLTIQQPETASWNIAAVYFRSVSPHSSITIPHEKAMNPKEPYHVGPVVPGSYQTSIYRSDNVIFNQMIDIPAHQPELHIIVRLPECSASISGQINIESSMIMIWNPDQTIQAVAQKRGDSTYAIRDLPPGQYRLSLSISMEEQNSVPVDLLPGQHLVVDLDGSRLQQREVGWLGVTVVDENGWPLENANVYLQAGQHIVEPKASIGWQIFFITAPGPYTLHVTAPGYKSLRQNILINPQPSAMTAMERQKITIRMFPIPLTKSDTN